MSRDDADFAAYLAARWPSLVRTLVLLGHPQPVVEELVVTAMARCYAVWDRIRSEDDVDTQVWEAILEGVRRRDEPPGGPPSDDAPDPALVALQAELDRLGGEAREVLALTQIAELDEIQVAELLGVTVGEVAGRGIRARAQLDLTGVRAALGRDDVALSPAEAFWLAAELIDVGRAPYDQIVARARDARRRRTRLVIGSLVVAAVVVGGLTWLGTRPKPEPDSIGRATVTRVENPVDVGWYADGKLHLDKVTVDLPGLTDFGEVNGGAVYGDRSGHVAFVDAQGEQQPIGSKASYLPLVVSVSAGWAAWIEPGDRGGHIVVWDAIRGAVLARLPVGPRVRLIGIDQNHVFYAAAGGDYGWTPPNGEPVALDRSGLIEVESATKVYQDGRTIDMVQPFFSVDFRRPGIDALLSPGGNYAVTAAPASNGTPPFAPILYDVRSGKTLPTGFGPDDFALDVTFGDNHSIVYLVVSASGVVTPHPLVVLRTCEIGADRCSDVVPLQSEGGLPILGS